MKECLQVKEFSAFSGGDNAVNMFLSEIGRRAVSVTPIYNTMIGGIEYVVVYWDVK